MSRAPARFGLPRAARLRTQREFRHVYRRGDRRRGDNLIVVGARRRQAGCRLGLSVSKAHGPAVRRNKIKRIFREAFRLERPSLVGNFDLILIPQAKPRYVLAEVRHELAAAVRALHAKSQRPRRRRGRRGQS